MYRNIYTNVVKINLKFMPIYKTNDHTTLQVKEKNFIDKFKPTLNKTSIIHSHKWKQTYVYMFIYTKIISKKNIIKSIYK